MSTTPLPPTIGLGKPTKCDPSIYSGSSSFQEEDPLDMPTYWRVAEQSPKHRSKLGSKDDLFLPNGTSLAMPIRSVLKKKASSAGPGSRRSIFGNLSSFQKKRRPREGSSGPDVVANLSIPIAPTPLQHSRKTVSIDMRRFTPPADYLEDAGKHYKPVDNLPSTYIGFLPAVPTPLQRFYRDDGSSVCLPGLYPMVDHPSILRESSFGSSKEESSVPSNETIEPKVSFELSQPSHFRTCNKSFNDCDTTTSTSHSSSEPHRVVFDPRITVIDYREDDARQWYSESELMQFQRRTVLMAQNYLMKHPHLIEKYNKPIWDEATGVYKRRALFSLPILGTGNEHDDRDFNEFSDHESTSIDCNEAWDSEDEDEDMSSSTFRSR